jgi:hypothetical protein
MYKILFFLHKTDDENISSFFKDHIIKKLEEITETKISVAEVESNLLLEQKYSYFCEISAPSKEEMDKLMYSRAGKDLNKSLMEFHENITVITVNFNEKK